MSGASGSGASGSGASGSKASGSKASGSEASGREASGSEASGREASAITARAVEPGDAPGLVALFEAASSPCYCRYWHFAGDKNEWLSRCYVEVGDNRRELEADVARGADEARGLVAVENASGGASRIIGWLKAAPAAAVTKAYEQRLYRGLPCFGGDRTGVFLLGCALVHPEVRRQGVLRTLIRAAKELAPGWGATALEALPRRPRDRVSDEELWVGPAELFLEEGFAEVHAFEPYPVVRYAVPV